MSHPELYYFSFSRAAERIRWALDVKGVPWIGHVLVPGLHAPRVWWATRQGKLPALRLAGRTVVEAPAVLGAVDGLAAAPALYPRDPAACAEVLALERHFLVDLGDELRRALLHDVFSAVAGSEHGAAMFIQGHGPRTQALVRAAFPLGRAYLRRRFGVTAAGAELARGKVLAILDRIARDTRASGYLVGGTFSAADLTAAALLSALVVPTRRHCAAADPARYVRFRATLAGHPALAWAAGIWERHRGPSLELAPDAAVVSRGRPIAGAPCADGHSTA